MSNRITFEQWNTTYGPPPLEDIAPGAMAVAALGARLRLKEWRQFSGLTLMDAAYATGLSASALLRYENGNAQPRLDTIIKLALIYNVAPQDMVSAPAGY